MSAPETTQTGVPIVDCGKCEGRHPASRLHCAECGRPSLFIDPEGLCLRCQGVSA